jgi:hypothetical protein
MHIDLENFQKVYYEKVKPLEEEFEKEKKKIYIEIGLIAIITISILILLITVLISKPSNRDAFKLVTYVIFGAILLSVMIIGKFTSKAKKTIFPTLFKSIDSNLIYDGKMKFPKDKCVDSNLFTSFSSSYHCEDSITAKVDNKDVEIYELRVETGSGKHKRTVFYGLFIDVVLDKNLKSDMKIVYNTTKDFGIIKTLFANEDKVNLENIDFENKYDVYCKDQIYARKIITLTFMEKLLYVTNKLNTGIEISFKNNNVYIAISRLQLINDGDLFTKKINMLNIAKDIDNVLEVIDTIDYLDLDEKIV